jgi:hypothetical protein
MVVQNSSFRWLPDTQASLPRGRLSGTKHTTKGTKFSFLKSYYVDDTAFVLLNREDVDAASKLIVSHFRRFGLTIHTRSRRKGEDVRLGVELELTSDQTHPPVQVARTLQQQAGRSVAVMTKHGMYREAHSSHEHWKLMSDASIACHINRPDCHAFELVSPILRGQTGLAECRTVLAGGRDQRES